MSSVIQILSMSVAVGMVGVGYGSSGYEEWAW